MGVTVVEIEMAREGSPAADLPRALKPRGSLADAVRTRRDCVPCRGGSPPERPSVAVVVPCRDYGHWLGEALGSVLAQTRPAAEIVVVDDSSADGTRAVAGSFAPRGVKYLRGEWGSVWEARKAGFLATRADVVCFLDADDLLPPDYLERGVPLFAPGVGVVYSDYQLFGDSDARSDFPAFDRARLDRENYMHAGSLVLRRAVGVARAFDAPRPANPWADWTLWRRVCDAGFTGVKSPAMYRYRKHGASMTLGPARAAMGYFEAADLANQVVTVVCPLSGRDWAWPRYRDWLESQSWPRGQCSLLVVDTGPTAGVRDWLAGCGYPDARYARLDVGREGLAEMDRRAHADEVRLAMSRIYRKAMAGLETPFAFILEDDIIPPLDTVARLMRSFGPDVAAVSGAYLSRFHPGYVAWRETPATVMQGGEGVEDMGGSGFGCLLARRSVLHGETFTPLPGESPDYDVTFFARLNKLGWKARIDWSVEAEHRSPPGLAAG